MYFAVNIRTSYQRESWPPYIPYTPYKGMGGLALCPLEGRANPTGSTR